MKELLIRWIKTTQSSECEEEDYTHKLAVTVLNKDGDKSADVLCRFGDCSSSKKIFRLVYAKNRWTASNFYTHFKRMHMSTPPPPQKKGQTTLTDMQFTVLGKATSNQESRTLVTGSSKSSGTSGLSGYFRIFQAKFFSIY